MKFSNLILSLGGLMLIAQHGTAQLSWTFPQLTADTGTSVSVSVTVTGYQDLISAQGTVGFDPLILDYTHVDNFALSSMTINSFGEVLADNGQLTFSWSELDLVGKDIADNDTLFTIHFDIIGGPGDSSLIELVGNPTSIEFVDASFTPITYGSTDGKVRINGGTADLNELSIQHQWTVYPNPANDWIEVSGVSQDGPLQIKWYSPNGQLVREDQVWVLGSKGKLITTELTQGMYLLQLGDESAGFENRLIRIL